MGKKESINDVPVLLHPLWELSITQKPPDPLPHSRFDRHSESLFLSRGMRVSARSAIAGKRGWGM